MKTATVGDVNLYSDCVFRRIKSEAGTPGWEEFNRRTIRIREAAASYYQDHTDSMLGRHDPRQLPERAEQMFSALKTWTENQPALALKQEAVRG